MNRIDPPSRRTERRGEADAAPPFPGGEPSRREGRAGWIVVVAGPELVEVDYGSGLDPGTGRRVREACDLDPGRPAGMACRLRWRPPARSARRDSSS